MVRVFSNRWSKFPATGPKVEVGPSKRAVPPAQLERSLFTCLEDANVRCMAIESRTPRLLGHPQGRTQWLHLRSESEVSPCIDHGHIVWTGRVSPVCTHHSARD